MFLEWFVEFRELWRDEVEGEEVLEVRVNVFYNISHTFSSSWRHQNRKM